MSSTVLRNNTICYLANASSSHTVKWCNWFSRNGFKVNLVSIHRCNESTRSLYSRQVNLRIVETSADERATDGKKLAYLGASKKVRDILTELKPDVVHAHYATSYGLLAALACERPYYLSVWGSDVYDFPRKSFFHKAMLQFSLSKAGTLLSTSKAMAEECGKYTRRRFGITPFGVDMELFSPAKRKPHDGFVIGTVKTLERKYGIDSMLRGCALLHDKRPDLDVRVRIAGKGSLEKELHELGSSLGMDGYLTWLGYIPQQEAAREWASFDVACIESESESFGVSAVEAQASGTPLVISDIPGLMEACNGGRTAIVTPRRNPEELARALEALADDPICRARMGANGRAYVEQAYEMNACFNRVKARYLKDLGVNDQNDADHRP